MSMPHLMDPIHPSAVGDNSSERGADLAGYGVVLLSCSKGYVEKAEGRSTLSMVRSGPGPGTFCRPWT